jgi:Ion transport protein
LKPVVRVFVRERADALLRPDRRFGHAFENLIVALIVALIVLSVVSVVVEATPGLPPWTRSAFHIEEITVVAVFSFEYLLRLAAARRLRDFVFSFQGVVDLIAIVPFFLAPIDTHAVRTVRLLRVLKLQTRILENTVAERRRELAAKNAALARAHAQLNAELDVTRAADSDFARDVSRQARLRCGGAHASGNHHGWGLLRLHRAAGWPHRAGHGGCLGQRCAGRVLHGHGAHQFARARRPPLAPGQYGQRDVIGLHGGACSRATRFQR